MSARRFFAAIDAMVDFCGRRPWAILALTALFSASTWAYATKLALRSDLRELLPSDSPGLRAYERQHARVQQGATLLVLARSPNQAANRRFVDELGALLARDQRQRASCTADCGPDLIASIETGSHDVHAFFERQRGLYAPLRDLEDVDAAIGKRLAAETGLFVDVADEPAPDDGARGESLLPRLRELRARGDSALRRFDPFPSGYFETPDGGTVGLRITSRLAGTGDGGEALLEVVRQAVAKVAPERLDPNLVVGYAGDIPNAIEERRSVASDAIGATALATGLILAAVVLFFRGPWALVVIGVPVFVGVGAAYAFATAAFGYVNSSGAFLGAIILGNGINYPIVLLARYRDFRAQGEPPEAARRIAVRNAFRAELVGAAVAAIAYGSLTVTRFRGFNQFGAIGFFGMLMVWIVVIPVVPALIALGERWFPRRAARFATTPPARRALQWYAGWLDRRAPAVLLVCASSALVAAAALPGFLRDPWEYNFARLGSRHAKTSGAGRWSVEAERVFGGKANLTGAIVLAQRPEQARDLERAILERDRSAPGGSVVADVISVEDVLPGPPEEQARKLELLARIRRRLAPERLASLGDEERRELEALRPPADLHAIGPKDLPPTLRDRFTERDGRVGAILYVRYRPELSLSNGRNLLRMAAVTDEVRLPDGSVVHTASRATVFAEIIRSLERDGPLATAVSFGAVVLVVLSATHSRTGAVAVLGSLLLGVLWMLGFSAHAGERLNFLNFVALPITFGIGSEYPFNVYDRSRLLGGDVTGAIERSGGPVALCSYTTIVGYGSLLVADNQALQSFGRLAIVGELACVTAALVFLPALLFRLTHRQEHR